MLTKEQIQWLLQELEWETAYEDKSVSNGPFRVQRKGVRGYWNDPLVGRVQATLSIMLEAAP